MPAPAIERVSDITPADDAVGRRRARLMQGIAKPAPAEPALSPTDVQALRGNPSAESRVQLAVKFGRQYDHLVDGETRSLADAVLHLLVKDLEVKVRQALSDALASSPKLPPDVVSRLAQDDIEVARPILERSPVLSDQELGEIVRTHAMQYALAVAGREHLSEVISDILAASGEAEVVARLVGNAGAQISLATLQRVAADYRDDTGVQDRLIRRPALPYELVDHLVGVIGERLEWDLVRQRRLSAEEAHQLRRRRASAPRSASSRASMASARSSASCGTASPPASSAPRRCWHSCATARAAGSRRASCCSPGSISRAPGNSSMAWTSAG
jgi:uncharacterized protein (DUF2336 family)